MRRSKAEQGGPGRAGNGSTDVDYSLSTVSMTPTNHGLAETRTHPGAVDNQRPRGPSTTLRRGRPDPHEADRPRRAEEVPGRVSWQSGWRGRPGTAQREDMLDECDEDVLGGVTGTGVAAQHRYIWRDGERLAHVVGLVVLDAIEAVDGDEIRQPTVLEEVDGREAVGQSAGVDHDDGADRAPHQFVPHEPEPSLTGGAEQVQ